MRSDFSLNTVRKERESRSGTKKILGKCDISKSTEGKKKETRVAIGAPAYRITIEQRAAASTKA